ncbi:uncharacterized protein LOC126672950 [Mercurialis annua]|uniref:uncharacterized protein LOC126672950 n=1 Tax=Mercurialis annua TaxID=3986 RepID=UPI00215ECA2E|nr:uncharacterized protein LOC126672950 [Mercurialis annua]
MATLNLSFVIWCDGRMVSSPAGVEYQGGRRADMPIIDRMNFEELRNICIRAVATDSEVEITKIYFRLPKIESGRIVSYSLYSVENNEHIFGILRETMRYRGLDTLEFYVEYRTVVCHDVSVDQLVLSESSGSEIGSDEDEDDEEDFFGCEEEAEEQEDCNDHDSGEDTVYQSQLPEGFNHVNLDDFDVAPESDENLMWNPGMEFQVGMIFPNRASVQACATAYSVENGREHKSRRTTNYTVVFACRYNPICKWWLRATLLQATHTWTCTKYIGPHTCNELVPNANHRNFGAREIAKYVRRKVMEQRDIRVNTLIAGIWDEHRVRPPYKRMWYAKEKAIASVYGDWHESFGCINDIMHNMVHAMMFTLTGCFSRILERLLECFGLFFRWLLDFRSIPSQYLAGSEVWRARVPLIYYNIVEWHQPDRVLQQFGLTQPIPLAPVQDHRLHSLLYKSSNNYMEILGYYVLIWLHRESHVVGGYRFERPPHYHSQYMEWYRRHTRRWITWQGAADGSSRDLAEMVHVRRSSRDSIIGSAARSSQMAYMEDRRDVTLPPPEPAVPAFVLPPLPPLTVDLDSIHGRRRQRPTPRQPRQRPDQPIPPPVYYHYDAGESSQTRQNYCGPTQFQGDGSQFQQHSQVPPISSFPVPPSSGPFFYSSEQTPYTTHLTEPAQYRQATPPPFQAPQHGQPSTPSDQGYRPVFSWLDQPSASHSRPSPSTPVADPSQMFFSISEAWLNSPGLGEGGSFEALQSGSIQFSGPSFSLLPQSQEAPTTAPAADDQELSLDDDHESEGAPGDRPGDRQYRDLTESSLRRRQDMGYDMRTQLEKNTRYRDYL